MARSKARVVPKTWLERGDYFNFSTPPPPRPQSAGFCFGCSNYISSILSRTFLSYLTRKHDILFLDKLMVEALFAILPLFIIWVLTILWNIIIVTSIVENSTETTNWKEVCFLSCLFQCQVHMISTSIINCSCIQESRFVNNADIEHTWSNHIRNPISGLKKSLSRTFAKTSRQKNHFS